MRFDRSFLLDKDSGKSGKSGKFVIYRVPSRIFVSSFVILIQSFCIEGDGVVSGEIGASALRLHLKRKPE